MTDGMKSSLEECALQYAGMGWKILPCHGINNRNLCTCGNRHKDLKDMAKHPAIDRWNEYSSSDVSDIEKWWHVDKFYNPALHCSKSGMVVIDIDPRGGGDVSFEKLLVDLNIELPATVEALTGEYAVGGQKTRGRHIYLTCDRGKSLVGNLSGLGYPGIDIKFQGYVMLPPSKHFSGVTYQWVEGRDPWTVPVAEIPTDFLAIIEKSRRGKVDYGMGAAINEEVLNDPKYEVNLVEAFGQDLVEGVRNETLYRMTVKITNHMSEFGRRPIDEFMERAILREMVVYNQNHVKPPLDLEELEYLVIRAINWVRDHPRQSYMSEAVEQWARRQQALVIDEDKASELLGATSSEESVSSKNLRMQITDGVKGGKSISDSTSHGNIDIPSDPDAVDIQDGGTPGKRSFSDIGNGRRLVDLFGPGVAYTPEIGWKTWTDGYWQEDKEGLAISELTKKLPPIILSEGSERGEEDRAKSWARSSQSGARLRSTIDIAKSDPRVMVSLDTWDSDPHLFGVANGVINLKTGELIKGAPELRISMRSNIDYIPGLQNPQWLEFLKVATGGDEEYIAFLKRAVGYTFTGLSNLDRIFMVYGPGGTGKNTFLEPIFTVLGEYATTLDTSIVTPTNGLASASDMYHIASLHSKRLAWVDELPEGERFKENTMKKLSGSGMLTGRHPGGRPFTFPMRAKVWISSNHRPPIYDDAMWRRLYALPFVHAPQTPDLYLKQYLTDPSGGAPGVLAWGIEGAIEILNSREKDFLGKSKTVDDSTEIYRKNEDKISLFIEEELVDAPGQTISVNTLYNRYAGWAEVRGEKPMSLSPLVRKLMDKGLSIGGAGTKAFVIDKNLAGYNEMKTAVQARYESSTFYTTPEGTTNKIIIGD
jgi:putative DNA primase/helicase